MYTLSFTDPDCRDTKRVGGKALGLSEMTGEGIPVSPGYAVTTDAYRAYLEATGLAEKLRDALESVDRKSIEALEKMEKNIAQWFDDVAVPADIAQAVASGYADLCEKVGVDDVSVAVRSSATAEDSAGTSFAGEYETYVGLKGISDIELHMRRCWASAFTVRALTYAWKNAISPLDVNMAVVIQKTVNARCAGVMFTLSPTTGDRSRIFIEAAYGLGLGVVGGEVTPDRYVVAKIGGTISDRVLGNKHIEYLTGHEATPVEPARQEQLCLSDDEVLAIANYGKEIERSHGAPMDIEFALDRDLPAGENVIFLQCRPETVWSNKQAQAAQKDTKDAKKPNLAAAVLASALKPK